MKTGIVKSQKCLIITERFIGQIIGTISINTPVNDVESCLGAPSIRHEDFIFYKTNQYYIGFKGKEKVELACLHALPQKYDADILSIILKALCENKVYLTDFLAQSEKAAAFFENTGFIHGGGNYAAAENGILIDSMSRYIEVYNNFEGTLYNMAASDNEYQLKYKNADYIAQAMKNSMLSYYYENKAFIDNAKRSPTGKYIARYEWVTSMIHNFVIRLTDFSKPDFTLPAAADEFEWITDDHIFYIGMFTRLPHIIRVDSKASEDIRLLEDICLVEGLEISELSSSQYDFELEDIKSDVIVLKEKNAEASGTSDAYWLISYHIDDYGSFVKGKTEKTAVYTGR